jgi:hypothetical protein
MMHPRLQEQQSPLHLVLMKNSLHRELLLLLLLNPAEGLPPSLVTQATAAAAISASQHSPTIQPQALMLAIPAAGCQSSVPTQKGSPHTVPLLLLLHGHGHLLV